MQVADGLEWRFIYFVRGAVPKQYALRNAISDPPYSGWGHALVLTGEKRSTIFCPFTLTAFQVANKCLEIAGSEDPVEPFRMDWFTDLVKTKWAQFQAWGFQRDYDTCALIMKRLGLEVPADVMTGGGEDTRKKGGKETGTKLLKPVKADSKRGIFLKWFLDGDCTRSVREAMAEFSMTRSNALSYLYMIQKDHGIGYTLVADMATVMLPDGCTDPFNEKQPAAEPTKVVEDDDSWLC